MSVLNITNFGGEIPRLPERSLPPTAAKVNENLLATSNEFRPLAQPGAEVVSFGPGAQAVRTLYRGQKKTDGSLFGDTAQGWITRPNEVSFVRGQLMDDSTERTYYTTDDGSAPPRARDNTGADYLLGVPRPPKPLVNRLTTKKFTIKKAREWFDSTLVPSFADAVRASLIEDPHTARFTVTPGSFVPRRGTTAGASRAGLTKLLNGLDGTFMYFPSAQADGLGPSQRGVVEPWNVVMLIPSEMVCPEGVGHPTLGSVAVRYGDNEVFTWLPYTAMPLWGYLDKPALRTRLQALKRPEVENSTERLWTDKQVDYLVTVVEELLRPDRNTAVKQRRAQIDASLQAYCNAGFVSLRNATRPVRANGEEDQTFQDRLADWEDLHAGAVAAMRSELELGLKIVGEIEDLWAKTRDGFKETMSEWLSGVPLEKTSENIDGLVVIDNDEVVETRFYGVTYVTSWGEESQLSEPSDPIDVQYNDLIVVDVPPRTDVAVGRNIVKWRIYRTNTGSTSAAFQFVAELDYATYSVPAPGAAFGNVGVEVPGFGDKDKWRDVVATWLIYTQFRGTPRTERNEAFRDTSKLRIGDTVTQTNGVATDGLSSPTATYTVTKTWNGYAWDMRQVPSIAGYVGKPVYVDGLSGAQLGEVCPTVSWTPPPYRVDPANTDRIKPAKGVGPYLRGLTGMANGIMAGFVDNYVAFCEAYTPYAWPVEYQIPVEYPVVGLCAFGQSLLVGTMANPYIMSGADPANMSSIKLSQSQKCVSARSMVAAMGGVFYASPDGYCFVGSMDVEVVTAGLFAKEEWQALRPETIFAAVHDSVLYFWYTDDTGTLGCYGLDMVARKLTRHDPNGATAAYEDVVTDAVYVTNSRGIVPLFASAGREMGRWVSALITLSQQQPLAWVRTLADFPGPPVTVRWFADGALRHEVVLTSREPQRLPPGRWLEHQVEVVSQNRVTQVLLASTTEELRSS